MLEDEHPVVRYWGAYGLFLARDSSPSVKEALRGIAKRDRYATVRIMAAQALGLCGDPKLAFETIHKEATGTNDGYVLLFAINAFQYSHTDDRLTSRHWRRFQMKKPPMQAGVDHTGFGYSRRIIDDALRLWPRRRTVD